jgi:energy-coupling factor transport system permease protein
MNLRVPYYRPTGSQLHAAGAGVAALYLAGPCAAALVYESPLVNAALLFALVGVGLAAGLGREIGSAARLALPLAVLVALVNPLVSREGLTVLIGGPALPVLGRIDITLEALAYGGAAALRVMVVVLAFALYSAAVDPDQVLRLFRRVSSQSALTASLATRLVPVLGRDAERLSAAYELRAARPAAGTRLARVRRAAILTRALTAGAIERAIDVAATLEVRGFALRGAKRSGRVRRSWSRHDFGFGAAALVMFAVSAAGRVAGLAGFQPYPLLRIDAGAADVGFALFLALLMLAPFGSSLAERITGAEKGERARLRSAHA